MPFSFWVTEGLVVYRHSSDKIGMQNHGNKLLTIVAGFLIVGALGVFGSIFAQRYVEQRVRVKLDQTIAQYDDKVHTSYRSVKFSLWKRSLAINGLKFSPATGKSAGQTFDLDRFEIGELDDASLLRMIMKPEQKTLPASMRISLVGAHVTPEMIGETAAHSLEDYGYGELRISTGFAIALDRQAETLAFNDWNIEVDDVGKLSSTFQFSQIKMPSDEELANPAQLNKEISARLMNAALHLAELRFTDLGLLKHVDAHLAATHKPSLAQSAKMMGAMLGGPRQPAKAQFLSDATPKVQDFLEHGGSIAIKAQPPKDQPFKDLVNPLNLMDPNAFATQIGVSIEVSH